MVRKRLAWSAHLFFAACMLVAPPCGAVIFGVTSTDLVVLDGSNPANPTRVIGPHGFSASGVLEIVDIAYDYKSDRLFGSVIDLTSSSNGLVEFNRTTGEGSLIAVTPNLSGIEYHIGQQELIGSRQIGSGNEEEVVRLNLDGTYSLIFDNNKDNDRLLYDPIVRSLYSVNGEVGQLNKPDDLFRLSTYAGGFTDNFATAFLGSQQLGGAGTHDWGRRSFLQVDSGYGMETANQNRLYRVTTFASGSQFEVDEIGVVPGDTIVGLAFAPEADRQVSEFSFESSFGSTPQITDPDGFFGLSEWAGDSHRVTDCEDGSCAFDGSFQLAFEATGPGNASGGVSTVAQYIDVSALSGERLRVSAGAWFNLGDNGLNNQFRVDVVALDDSTNLNTLGRSSATLLADDDPLTWEPIVIDGAILPEGTGLVRLELAAVENIDSLPFGSQFGSNFADAAFLSVVPAVTRGDFNRDAVVNASDYVVWRDTLGETQDYALAGADGSGNTVIDNADYERWAAMYGAVDASVPAPSSVPEPATPVALVLAWISIAVSRRR